MNLKGLEYEYVPVHLVRGEQRSEEYARLNPTQAVPTLVHGDFAISESMAILDYLESVQPKPKLLPEEPRSRAEVIRFCEVINSGIQPLQNLKINKWLTEKVPTQPDLKNEWNVHWIEGGLRIVEELLRRHGGRYSYGDQISAADCLLVPQVFASKRFGVDVTKFPTIVRVAENCETLEAFKAAHPSKQPDAE